MKTSKTLIIFLMVLISILAIGAVSAADGDDIADDMELSDTVDEIGTVELNENQKEILSDGEDPADVDMTVNVENVTYGDPINVDITVTDESHTVVLNQCYAEVYVDDVFINNVTLSDEGRSSFALAVENPDVGKYYMETYLFDSADKIIAFQGISFQVTKATPIVILENVSAISGAGVKVPINVTDKNGNKVSGDAIVSIQLADNTISKYAKIVNGTAEASFDMADMMGSMMGGGGMNFGDMFSANSSENGSGGMGSFNFSDMKQNMNGSGGGFGPMAGGSSAVKFTYYLNLGNYTISAVFLPNRNYVEAEGSSDLSIVYPDIVYVADITTPEKMGDDTLVTVILWDKYGNPIPNTDVTLLLDNSTEVNTTVNDNGMATVKFENLLNGAHKLFISSNATGNMTNQTYTFDIIYPKVNTTLTANAMSVVTVNTAVDGKIGKYFTVTLKDSSKNAVSGKKLQISIDNKKYTVTTDKNGQAKIQINIAKAGTYTATVAFLGDDDFNGVLKTAKVTVKKQAAKLSTGKKTYKVKAKSKKLTATFKSAKGNAIKNKKISFKVNGKTYTAKTNSKGVATVNVKISKKGTYTFTARFAGDNTYKAISKKAKLIVR